jgi:FkbM family methyltransferase
MIRYLIRLPILKRLIPSLITRYYKITKKNKNFFKIGKINFYLDYLDPLDRQIIINENYEHDQVVFLEQIMDKENFSYFFDIGANSGYYSFYFALKFKNLKVISFEPNIEAYDKFNKTLQKNSFKNVKIYNLGLSDNKRKVQMRSMIKNGFIQSNSAITETSHAFDVKDFKIKYADLDIGDNLLKYRNKKLSMKIDVEGHEINTLKGLKNILKNNKCLLLIEISEGNFNEVDRLLKNFLYRCIFKSEYRSDYIYTNLNSDINQI